MQQFELNKVRDFGSVISDTFTYIRAYWKSLGKALILLCFPLYLVSGVLLGQSYSSIMEGALNQSVSEPDLTEFGVDMITGIFLLLVASTVLVVVTVRHISMVDQGEEPDFQGIISGMGKESLMMIGLYLILAFILPIAFFFFIIPGIWLTFKLCLAPTALIIEKNGIIEAFKCSWELTAGHWWETAGLYLVMNIITSFMSYAISIPFMIIITMVTVSGADTSGGMFGGALGIFYGLLIVLSSLFSVVILLALSLHYFNLVERKEGVSLKAQIEELGN